MLEGHGAGYELLLLNSQARVNDAAIVYRGVDYNSNSYAYTLLKKAGLLQWFPDNAILGSTRGYESASWLGNRFATLALGSYLKLADERLMLLSQANSDAGAVRSRHSGLVARPVHPGRGEDWFFLRLALVLSIVLLAISCKSSGPTVEEVRALIDKEIPPGSSAAQVVTFLDSRHIEHSDLGDAKEHARIIYASIPHVKRDLFNNSYGMFLMFAFDTNEKLVSYGVQMIGNA